MKKGRKCIVKIISCILATVILLSALPLSTFAAQFKARQMVQSETEENIPENVLYEITSKRDANTKVYKKSDGSYAAVFSSVPIHYEQDGKWLDIDNTLQAKNKKLENIQNRFHVSFPNKLHSAPVSISCDTYQLDFSLLDAADSKAAVKENTKPKKRNQTEMLADSIGDKTRTSVVYKNVFKHTDLEYVLRENFVKENIVIKKASAAQACYCFQITAKDLTGKAGTSGSITFLDSKQNAVFEIPAPVMLDANNAVSRDVAVDFQDVGDGKYMLKYIPDSDWLQDASRKYPVKLDPAVGEVGSRFELRTMVSSANPDTNYYDCYQDLEILPEDYSNYEELLTYMYPFPENFQLSWDNIKQVTLSMRGQLNGILGAYYVDDDGWKPEEITFNTRPNTADEPFDYYYGKAEFYDEASWISFDLTEYVNNSMWANGIMLRLMPELEEEYPEDWYAILNRLPWDDQMDTFLYVEYQEDEIYSIASSAENHSIPVGRAGTAAINEGSGRISVYRNDIGIAGNLMPAQIDFAYNMIQANKKEYLFYDSASDNLTAGEMLATPYGENWLTSYNKFFFVTDLGENQAQYMFYDGSSLIPLSVSKNNHTWEVAEAYPEIFPSRGYTFTVSAPETEERPLYALFDCITVHSPDGTLQSYDQNGRLTKIYKEKYPNQSIQIKYEEDGADIADYFAIDYVLDGVDRKYEFSYQNENLCSIECFAADGTVILAGSTEQPMKMVYGYADNRLNLVTFPDGKSVRYASDMTQITNIDGRGVNFYGTSDCSTGYYEFAKDADGKLVTGETLHLNRDGNQVKISNGSKSVTKQFDEYGRPVLEIDADGNYCYYDYTNNPSGSPTVSAMRSADGNLLKNGSFENGLQAWDAVGITETDVTEGRCGTGTYALQWNHENEATAEISQTVSDLMPGVYTFSAYVQTEKLTEQAESLRLILNALSETGEVLKTETRPITLQQTAFTQYFCTMEAPSGTRKIHVQITSSDAQATFRLDDIQLEKSAHAGDANLVLNGDFQDDLTAWQYEPYRPWITSTRLHNTSAKALCMRTDFMEQQSVQNTVTVQGKKGEVVVVGAWIDTSAIILNAPEYIYDLSRDVDKREAYFAVMYSYLDEKGVEQTVCERLDLQEHISDWTYYRQTLVLQGDCQNITIAFGLSGAYSSLYITNVDVMKSRENPASTLPTEPELPQEIPEQPKGEVCVCGEACAFGAGCTCSCASAQTCECPQCKKKFDISYDEFGNLLSVKLLGLDFDTLLTMLASRSYDGLGNYMTSSTNENGQTIRYQYNANNGVLQSTIDARGHLTAYTYDAIGALTSVKTPVSALTNLLADDMITAYEYTNDRVSKIRHNDFSYNLVYDVWGNVKSIFVGALDTALTIPFVEYTYGTGDYRSRIEKIAFKNGNTIVYRYDGDRLTGISYDGGNYYAYEYAYDELGYLTEIQDHRQNRVIYYSPNSVEVYTGDTLLYSAATDADGNVSERVQGNLFVTVTYAPQQDVKSEEQVYGTGIRVGENELCTAAKTDKFGRRTQKSVAVRRTENANAPVTAVTTDFDYQTYTVDKEIRSGSRIEQLQSTVKMPDGKVSASYAFAYAYDENNNITHEYAVDANGNKTLRQRYTYDEADQLVRVDDNVAGQTYVYTYNKGGNRIMSKVYAYTLGSELGKMQYGDTALYTDPIWRDRMTSFHGQLIVYDKLGNPKSYNGNTYEWEGRQLKSISNSSGKTEFSYDADGLRTETRQYDANGKRIQTDAYIWQDGLLTAHSRTTPESTETVKILYDADKKTVGFLCGSGEAVLFVRNLQGDVVALVDETGKVVVEYTYDAWGNMFYRPQNGTTQEQAQRLVQLCPITYRGYNYDFCTGLYYLQSRYYNPKWGRFLNCDDTNILLSTRGEDHGANLFAYGNNNPVNRVDYTGYECEELISIIIPILIGLSIFAKYDASNFLLDNANTSDVMVDTTIDSYGFFFIKCAAYNQNDGKYHVKKAMYGTVDTWSRYFAEEGRMVVTFNNTMAQAVASQTRTLLQPGNGQMSFGGIILVWAFDATVYGAGRFVLDRIYKGDYIEKDLNKKENVNATGFVAYTKEETVHLRSTAWLKVQSNFKPREEELENVRVIW